MQVRMNDVTVNECPKFLCPAPTPESHAIVALDEHGNDVVLPLMLNGVTSYLPCLSLTQDEWDLANHPRIVLTADHITWSPSATTFSEQEDAMTDHRGDIFTGSHDSPPMIINGIMLSTCAFAADIHSDLNYGRALASHEHVTLSEITNSQNKYGDIKSTRGKKVDGETLAKRWGIDLAKARNTINVTTQRGVRSCLHPSLSRRYPTNDRMLRYRRMPDPVFTDTMFSGVLSKRQHKCAQAFCTSYGWSRCHPMRSKGEAHEALSLLFKRDGVPPKIVIDDSKEQAGRKFREKCKEVDCHLTKTEPYSPWMQLAEGCIKELKKGSSRKMIQTGSPKRLWDHCIELQALVRSHTAHNSFALDGETPETRMTGQTADISNLCEYSWYDWVMFRDGEQTYPNEKMRLGRYLGPATDVGSAMTQKILVDTGEVWCRTTVRSLTDSELTNPAHIASRVSFDLKIEQRLGPNATVDDFEADELTPAHEYYSDGTDNVIEGSPDDLPDVPATSEWQDQYVNVDLMFPRGTSLARGRVTKRKRDDQGSPMGNANQNPILDT